MIKLEEIKSVSIDMSTEETPYNRIYAKPIEKQGNVLLCEFESANYDINKKENMIKSYQEENTKLKEKIVKMKDIVLNTEINNMKSIIEIVNTAKENAQLKELLKECRERLIYCTISTQDVQAKINQVLADNKIQANTVACNKIQENE